jgi:hypothetical protein
MVAGDLWIVVLYAIPLGLLIFGMFVATERSGNQSDRDFGVWVILFGLLGYLAICLKAQGVWT